MYKHENSFHNKRLHIGVWSCSESPGGSTDRRRGFCIIGKQVCFYKYDIPEWTGMALELTHVHNLESQN